MNTNNSNPEDSKLRSLLRESRPAPSLPPRFQENVWRRIADAETVETSGAPAWLESLVSLVLRPKLAFASLALLVLAGAAVGMRKGNEVARHEAQVRYVASVAPNPVR